MKKIIPVVWLIVVALILSVVFVGPNILCEPQIPENYLKTIKNQSRGFYSLMIPLVPVRVVVDSFSGVEVCYTIYYFPFGTVGMSYIEGDGFSIEKTLIGL